MPTAKIVIDMELNITNGEQKILNRLAGLYGEDLVEGVLSDIICMMIQDKFQAEGTEILIGEIESMCEAYGELENA